MSCDQHGVIYLDMDDILISGLMLFSNLLSLDQEKRQLKS
jgi:hypothetical protein